PRLGLNAEEHDRLAAEIDTIYHNGAHVDALFPFEQLRAANVGGTEELLRLATTSWLKPFHFVSTVSVTDLELSGASTQVSGYVESKWRAERIVEAAASAGVPASIYRVPRLTGDSRTGRSNNRDIMFRILRLILELGVCPDIELSETWIPVDEAARLIIMASRRPQERDRFVLMSERQVHLPELLEAIREVGHEIEVKPFSEWENELAVRSPEEREIISSIFQDESGADTIDVHEDTHQEVLHKEFTPIIARGVDERTLRLYVDSLYPHASHHRTV
ncbi:MAG: SDR family oxidoreductase, partial [Candidatus Binatia bacterium]